MVDFGPILSAIAALMAASYFAKVADIEAFRFRKGELVRAHIQYEVELTTGTLVMEVESALQRAAPG